MTEAGFPQVSRTWGGGSSKLDGGIKSIHGGAWRGFKCCQKKREGVDLIVKLPAISLQACKFIEKKIFLKDFS